MKKMMICQLCGLPCEMRQPSQMYCDPCKPEAGRIRNRKRNKTNKQQDKMKALRATPEHRDKERKRQRTAKYKAACRERQRIRATRNLPHRIIDRRFMGFMVCQECGFVCIRTGGTQQWCSVCRKAMIVKKRPNRKKKYIPRAQMTYEQRYIEREKEKNLPHRKSPEGRRKACLKTKEWAAKNPEKRRKQREKKKEKDRTVKEFFHTLAMVSAVQDKP